MHSEKKFKLRIFLERKNKFTFICNIFSQKEKKLGKIKASNEDGKKKKTKKVCILKRTWNIGTKRIVMEKGASFTFDYICRV